MRDALFASLLVDKPRIDDATLATASLQLSALLHANPGTELAEPEVALLQYWLERLAKA